MVIVSPRMELEPKKKPEPGAVGSARPGVQARSSGLGQAGWTWVTGHWPPSEAELWECRP
jgi:hypothetical protein